MYFNKKICVIIPAKDEQPSIGLVVSALKKLRFITQPVIDEIIVCDNGSQDLTAETARAAGATVVYQPSLGYGIACLTAMKALPKDCDIVLFVDGDHAFKAEQCLDLLVGMIAGADMVIGSRVLGEREPGALTGPQMAGNWVASLLIKLIWKQQVTDLGPFRAISYPALQKINMLNHTFGWTVEMQIKMILHRFTTVEKAVDTRVRIGVSKVSGTLKGSIGAGVGILSMIAKLWWQHRRSPIPLKPHCHMKNKYKEARR